MRPKLELLTPDLIARVLDEAFQLMRNPGIKIQSAAARELLIAEGAMANGEIVKIPERIIRKALYTVPELFHLYDRNGQSGAIYGGDTVQFDPGSCGVHVLDPESLEHKTSLTADLVRIVKIAEMLPQYAAQSTAVVCNEVPKAIGDLYRLYIVLAFSEKPIVTGSFSTKNLSVMFDMLAIFAGGRQAFWCFPAPQGLRWRATARSGESLISGRSPPCPKGRPKTAPKDGLTHPRPTKWDHATFHANRELIENG